MQVLALPWGQEAVPPRLQGADLVLCCDCVYQPQHYASLLATLRMLHAAQYLVAWMPRAKGEGDFLQALEQDFHVTQHAMSTMQTRIYCARPRAVTT